MRCDYNKLVQVHVLETIRASGKKGVIETMPEAEYRQLLLEKADRGKRQESFEATPEDLITELADLQEVIAALLAAWQLSLDLVQQVQRQRHSERGDFEQRLKLLWTEDGDEDV